MRNVASIDPEMRKLADGFARGELDRASPDETRARSERIRLAGMQRERRDRELSDAAATIRKHGIRNAGELLRLVQCVHSAIPQPVEGTDMEDAALSLMDICLKLDDEVTQ